MPRPERPLDPESGSLAEFAADLRQLRREAGNPGYRILAAQAHYSATTLSDAAGGRKLPSLAVTLAYVSACGGDPAPWEARWRELAAETDGTDPDGGAGPADEPAATAPYVGLAAFGIQDAARFFGRDRLVGQLLDRLAGHRFVAVFGASGSGKSSLVRAGLMPTVAERGWPVLLMTPGAHPAQEAAAGLAGLLGEPIGQVPASGAAELSAAAGRLLADAPQDHELLLVVDQWEELFTLCDDHVERAGFISALLELAQDPANRVRVVIGVRADFYGRCAEHPGLVEALGDAQLLVGPMTADELRAAIIQPAQHGGYTVEGALLSRLTAEATGQAGVLPLVSHALLETWRRRRGNTLTLNGYEAAGGIQRAVANTAETAYVALDPAQQRLARQIFLRLTALGEGTEDTKRRIARTELDHEDPNTAVVLDTLATARLVTVDADAVEIAHEALIRSWPRLAEWLAADREGRRVHRQLTEATATWESLGGDPGALYRGIRLDVARDWADRGRDALTPRERAFLEASITAEDRQRATEQRRTRQLRWLAAALAVLLVAAVGVSVVAMQQRREAFDLRQIATSRQLAAEAINLSTKDVSRAIRLSVEAFHAHPTLEARSILLSLAARQNYHAQLHAPTGDTPDVALSADGRWLVSGGTAGTVLVWDVQTRTRAADLTGTFTRVNTLEFSRDGKRLAIADLTGRVMVWDFGSRTLISEMSGPHKVLSDVTFSPDGRLVAGPLASSTTGVRLWDPDTGRELGTLPGQSRAIAIAPDGATLVSVADDGRLSSWDLATRRLRNSTVVSNQPQYAVTVSQDGRMIATGGADQVVRLWDASTMADIGTLEGHDELIQDLAFVKDSTTLISVGRELVTWDVPRRGRLATLHTNRSEWVGRIAISGDTIAMASAGKSILLWDRAQLPMVGHTDGVNGIAFSGDGRTLASVSADQTLTLWDFASRAPRVSVPNAHLGDQLATDPIFSPDSATIATISGEHTVTLWDAAKATKLKELALPAGSPLGIAFDHQGTLFAITSDEQRSTIWEVATQRQVSTQTGSTGPYHLTFSQDGKLMATANQDGRVLLWDRQQPEAAPTVLEAHTGTATIVQFSRDGKQLATSGTDGTVLVWDVATRTKAVMTGHTGTVFALAFSPDGTLLAAAGDDSNVTLFDTATRTHLATLTGHTDTVSSIAWTPDGKAVVTGSQDQTITPWITDTDEATRRLCAKLTRDFRTAEPAPAACTGK